MASYKDETGHVYGKWTVLRKADQRNSCGEICWICQCECGTIRSVSGKVLRRGKSKSCGCNIKQIKPGDVFNQLTVIKDSCKRDNYGHKIWECQCSCGKIIEVRGNNLTSGNTKSCGCSKPPRLNLLNKRFGLLTVIEDAGNDNYGNSIWKCKCDCGKIKIIKGGNIISGNTITCGCGKMSRGQIAIKNILDDNDIKYISEYQPLELHGKRFDFALLNEDGSIQRLIEFDGIQHFEEWDRENKESLQDRQNRDKIKNEWAKENHIPLIRIPYWELNNLTKEMIFSNKYLL